jgi:molybdopterin synthase catalytic subunit/molybdopterin synthase sulfur carrier subunit
MIVRVKMFALARQLAGRETVEVELSEGGTIGQLRERLAADVPQLAPLMKHLTFAVGTDYAGDQVKIPKRADVACIPPVSGG